MRGNIKIPLVGVGKIKPPGVVHNAAQEQVCQLGIEFKIAFENDLINQLAGGTGRGVHHVILGKILFNRVMVNLDAHFFGRQEPRRVANPASGGHIHHNCRIISRRHTLLIGLNFLPPPEVIILFPLFLVVNDYLVALVFLGVDPSYKVVTQRLADLTGTFGNDWHLLTAGAFVTMILPIVVFFSLQRFFVRGLLAGSVKG